jgi:DNA-binding LytR/AlgR family response regulator
MKLRIEISDECTADEVIVRCKEKDETVNRLEAAFWEIVKRETHLALFDGSAEHYVPMRDILFFESNGKTTTAHTADSSYSSDMRLCKLEKILDRSFFRVSKFCIVNTSKISSISKSIPGSGEACFFVSKKKVYVSRTYYKALKDFIYETRIAK